MPSQEALFLSCEQQKQSTTTSSLNRAFNLEHLSKVIFFLRSINGNEELTDLSTDAFKGITELHHL